MIDFYELLGIKKDASESEIRSAYRQMAKKYHPDVNKGEDANKVIISLNEAKETLLNASKRKEYDKLLDEMKYSKQASKNKSETYQAKKKEYRKKHSDDYVTRWQYLMNYLKHSLDSKFIKFFKIIIVFLNYLIFSIIRLLTICFIYLLFFLQDLINYLIIILFIIAFLSLIDISNITISFDYPNIKKCILFSTLALIILLIKNIMMKKYVNLLVVIQNMHDKIFIFILNKL